MEIGPAGPDPAGWADTVDAALDGYLTPAAEASRERWVYDGQWPAVYLDEAAADDGYLDAVVQNVGPHAPDGWVELSRAQDGPGLPDGVVNASALPGWGDRWAAARGGGTTVRFRVPVTDVVGIGHPEEGEMFVRTARAEPAPADGSSGSVPGSPRVAAAHRAP